MNWVERYFAQTRSAGAELTRYFFQSLLRPEALSTDDSYLSWLGQILGVLIALSWSFPMQWYRRYLDLHAAGDPREVWLAYATDCFWLMIVLSLLTALVSTLQWPAMFPSRRDHLILSPLPLTKAQLFGAKLAALLLFMTLFVAACVLLTGLAMPMVESGNLELRPVWRRIAGLLISSSAVCYFVFFSLLAIQGVVTLVLPLRWVESAAFGFQVFLLIALLCLFPLLPYVPVRHWVETQSASMNWLPPAWFWGWGEWLSGSQLPQTAGFARKAIIASSVACLLAGTTYLVSYLRYNRFAMEVPRQDRAPLVRWSAWLGRWFPFPEARAIAEFVALTLLRGRQQKLIFLLVFGIGFSLALEGAVYYALHPPRYFRQGPQVSQLASAMITLPLMLSLFSMLGLRRAFRMPAELPANWLFRFVEDPALRYTQLDAVFTSFVLFGGIPILIASAPLTIAAVGVKAVWVLGMQGLLLWTFAEYLMLDWTFIPFTFSQNPARRHFMQSVVIHLVELTFYVFFSASWIQAGLNSVSVAIVFALVVVGILKLLRRRRLQEWGGTPLDFAEPVPSEVEPLRLLPD